MQKIKNKTMAIFFVILMLTSTLATVILPTTNAHTPAWQIPTYAYIHAAPSPIGVGQSIVIYMWLDCVINSGYLTNTIRFHNYNLTITAPDGTKETKIFDYIADPTSNQLYTYTPSQVGTYTLDFNFPGQLYDFTQQFLSGGTQLGGYTTSDYVNDTYLPSHASTTLTVQQEPLPEPINYPLPTDYWTRPIYGENPNWYSISSNWLGTASPAWRNKFVSDAVGSQTSHIMWTKPLQSGGVVGGTQSLNLGDTYFDGSSYIARYTNPIIVDGMLIYKEPLSFGSGSGGATRCVNLQTGELIWSSDTMPTISFAYVYDMQNAQQHGTWAPILISVSGSTWRAFDADTATPLWNATNVPSGAKVQGPQGEYLQYVMANAGTTAAPDWRLGEWNSTNLGNYGANGYGYDIISGSVDASISTGDIYAGQPQRYDWNVSIPWRNTMPSAPTVIRAFYNDIMICYNGSLPVGYAAAQTPNAQAPYTYFAINLNASKAKVGSMLWMKTYDQPAGNITIQQAGVDLTNRVFIESYKETNQFVGYSMNTGARLWGPLGNETSFAYYNYLGYGPYVEAYGKLYSCGFGGIMYCYDTSNGKLLWTYGNGGPGNSTSGGLDQPKGNYPTSIGAIGNGVIYTLTCEHTVSTPIYKGSLARAINATDGTEIWTLSDYGGSFGSANTLAIADGYTNFINSYDMNIYTVGRGPSALTVTAPNIGVDSGRPVVIRGTLTDVSAGTKQDQQASDFPNGVPCASDTNMKDWMGYVYQQKPIPTNFVGVPVSIDVTDSNGNYRNIGSATTDASGMYSLTWTPDIPGNYTVSASFAGTNGYWPANSETSFAVMEAPAATAPSTPLPQSPADMYFVPAIAGLFVLIIIVLAAVMILMLRKRP